MTKSDIHTEQQEDLLFINVDLQFLRHNQELKMCKWEVLFLECIMVFVSSFLPFLFIKIDSKYLVSSTFQNKLILTFTCLLLTFQFMVMHFFCFYPSFLHANETIKLGALLWTCALLCVYNFSSNVKFFISVSWQALLNAKLKRSVPPCLNTVWILKATRTPILLRLSFLQIYIR